MNKETAKEKRCPIKQDGNNNCIADGCMMWEWNLEYEFHKNWKVPPIITLSNTNGDCGLKHD